MLRGLSLRVAFFLNGYVGIVLFSPVVAYAQTGACCQDVTDGPLLYEGCADTDENSCKAVGMFHAGTTCGAPQACCLSFGTDPLCRDEFSSSGSPLCCLESGGVPQGEGTTCGDGACSSPSIPPPIPAVSGRGLVVATVLLIALGSLMVHRRYGRIGSRV